MNDITILHLSDLHIDDSGASYSRLLSQLLNDIKSEITHTKNKSLVVVVTGDILHKSPKYSDNAKAVEHALKFFKDLHSIVADKVAGIYIVPGNHDKFRTPDNKFLIPAYRALTDALSNSSVSSSSTKFDMNFYNHFWKFHLETYKESEGSGYLELTKQIYMQFGIKEEDIDSKSYISDTFGVNILNVLGNNFCFVLLNTSWSCIDDNDNRNIFIGEFQIEKIKQQFRNYVDDYDEDNRPALTIVMGHHPLGALRGNEEDKIFNEMISFDSLDANVYLCGHTHDRTVNNWVNNRHSINTFVTGIGWPENSNGAHVGAHTYSMYVFNIDANSVDVYVRSTNDGGVFSPDFRIYTNKQNADCHKLVFPIKSHKAQTYISLSVGNNRSPKAYYISEDFIKTIKEYVLRIQRIRGIISTSMENDKRDIFENIDLDSEHDETLDNYLFADIPNETDEFINKIDSIFNNNKGILFNSFLGFFQRLCQKIQEVLFEDKCSESDIVRIHFRYLSDRKTLQYLRLCTSFSNDKDLIENDVSEIKYGQLIEESYVSGCSLIYSINEEFTDRDLKEKWTNFITVVPLFDRNIYTQKAHNQNKKVPFITFGITTNSEKFNPLLYCMDYFSIKATLEEIIEQYLDLFRISMDEFCKWLKHNLEQEK